MICTTEVELIEPKSPDELEEYFAFRWQLLRAPWRQEPGSEKDELEALAHHLLARTRDGQIVGVGRLHFTDSETAQIRYMAVRESFRRRGVGKAIARRLENTAMALGARQIILNARQGAVGFYERLGYSVYADGPTIFGQIEHKRMKKSLGELRPPASSGARPE